MKILIATLLLGALGAGSLHFAKADSPQAAPLAPVANACDVSVTCTPEGNCQVTCEGPGGETCSVEIPCDGSACQPAGCSAPQACPTVCPMDCQTNCSAASR
ncbi:MAG TPA: hypothetical protein VK843_21575 [Planctomycetota bacterium]|nr:hypothetical protein [Planctomycetota bacterium]